MAAYASIRGSIFSPGGVGECQKPSMGENAGFPSHVAVSIPVDE